MKVDIYEIWTDADGLKMSLRVSIPPQDSKLSSASLGSILLEKLNEAMKVAIKKVKRHG